MTSAVFAPMANLRLAFEKSSKEVADFWIFIQAQDSGHILGLLEWSDVDKGMIAYIGQAEQ